MSQRDYYELLNVDRDANTQEIKRSYRRLAMKYHPDRNQGDKEAENKFKEIQEAYAVLADERKRGLYDQFGHAGVDPNMNGGNAGSNTGDVFGDFFNDIFGSGQGRSSSQRGQSGADLQYQLDITLEEAVAGVDKEIQIPNYVACEACSGSGEKTGGKSKSCSDCKGSGQLRMQQGFFTLQQTCPRCQGIGKIIDPCDSCQGQGRVRKTKTLSIKIPSGVDTGDRIRLPNEGEAGIHGGSSGDLYVLIKLQEHEVFRREANDLHCEVPVSFITCCLGGELDVPTLQGKARLKIPAGTQSGKTFRLRSKGVKSIRSHHQGDLFCMINVETPINLTKTQKETLQAFGDSLSQDNSAHEPKRQSWFEKVKSFF